MRTQPPWGTARAFLILVIVCWLAAAAHAAPSGDLTITLAAPQSGRTAFIGVPLVEGTRLAVDEINAAGGIDGHKIRLVVTDDQNDVATAVKNARDIAADGQTLAVIGHRLSDTSLEAGKVYAQAGLPAITPTAGAPAVTRDNPWYFRVIADTDDQGRFLVEYTRQVLGCSTVRIFADDSPYGQSLRQALEAACKVNGVRVEGAWTVAERDPDLERKVSEVVKACARPGASSVILMATGEDAGWRFLAQMRDAGDTSPVVGGSALGGANVQRHFTDMPKEKERPGFYLDGVMGATTALRDVAGEKAQRFYRRYKETFGHEADGAAAASYDAAMLAMRGLSEIHAGGGDVAADRKKLRDWLEARNSPATAFLGTTGRIFFDAHHSAVKSFPLGRFQSGRFLAAPTQLELIPSPDRVPNFDKELAAGNIIKIGDRYMSKVQVVYVGLDIIGVPDINQRTGEFTADLFVWFRYRGKLPTDELDFVNTTRPIVLGDPLWTRTRGDMTISTWRVKSTFSTRLQYADYPFDRQTLAVSLRHHSRTNSTFVLATDVLGMSLKDKDFDALALDKLKASFASSLWRPVSAISYQSIFRSDSTLGEADLPYAETGLEYSQINAAVEVRRDVPSYLIKNLLPLALITLILYMTNFVPVDQIAPRVNVAVTALLTSVVLYQRLSGDLPNIGYLVLMDYGFFIMFGLCIVQAALSVASYVLSKQAEPRRGWLRLLHVVGLLLIPVTLLVSYVTLLRHYSW